MHLRKKPKNRCFIEKHPQAGTKSDIYNLILQCNNDFPNIILTFLRFKTLINYNAFYYLKVWDSQDF